MRIFTLWPKQVFQRVRFFSFVKAHNHFYLFDLTTPKLNKNTLHRQQQENSMCTRHGYECWDCGAAVRSGLLYAAPLPEAFGSGGSPLQKDALRYTPASRHQRNWQNFQGCVSAAHITSELKAIAWGQEMLPVHRGGRNILGPRGSKSFSDYRVCECIK